MYTELNYMRCYMLKIKIYDNVILRHFVKKSIVKCLSKTVIFHDLALHSMGMMFSTYLYFVNN